MGQYTSAEASKLLRKLNEDRAALLAMESRSKSFIASANEDLAAIAPEYDHVETAKALDALNEKIRKVRHAINVFNTTHKVESFDKYEAMTIDEVLIALPQLTERKEKLARMKDSLPKTRLRTIPGSNVIEYEYANYDIKTVQREYDDVSAALSTLQLALDKINTTEKMEIDV